MDIQTMEEIALRSRPELMESRYQKRISSKDTRAAMLALIPSLKINAAYGYTNNNYLLNQDTTEYGASIGGNLFDIFSIGAARKASKANQEVIAERHLAIAMTVVSVLTGASLWEAGLVALVEPTINGFWYYLLDKIWSKYIK